MENWMPLPKDTTILVDFITQVFPNLDTCLRIYVMWVLYKQPTFIILVTGRIIILYFRRFMYFCVCLLCLQIKDHRGHCPFEIFVKENRQNNNVIMLFLKED